MKKYISLIAPALRLLITTSRKHVQVDETFEDAI